MEKMPPISYNIEGHGSYTTAIYGSREVHFFDSFPIKQIPTIADNRQRSPTIADDHRRPPTIADDRRRSPTVADDSRRSPKIADSLSDL